MTLNSNQSDVKLTIIQSISPLNFEMEVFGKKEYPQRFFTCSNFVKIRGSIRISSNYDFTLKNPWESWATYKIWVYDSFEMSTKGSLIPLWSSCFVLQVKMISKAFYWTKLHRVWWDEINPKMFKFSTKVSPSTQGYEFSPI